MTGRSRALPNLTSKQQLLVVTGVVLLVLAGAVAYLFHFSRIEHYQVRWDDARKPPAVSEDGRDLTLQYTGGACDDYAEAEVDEGPKKVTITITVTTKAVTGCDDIGVLRTMSVRLTEPLGDRTLIDGADE